MKYNEAIDMILDGGEAYRRVYPGWRYRFDDFELEESGDDGDWNNVTENCYFLKEDFTETDWIVDKDGVVYEEYPIGKMHIIEQRVPIDIIKKYIKDRSGTEGERANLEETGEQWEEIKMPIIADEVNEDWLENKVLCFMTKVYAAGGISKVIKEKQKGVIYHWADSVCLFSNCQFCFPKEKEDHIPDVSKKVQEERTCHECGTIILYCEPRYALESVPNYCYCLRCWNEMVDYEKKRNAHIEQPSDKVTVEDILYLINGVIGAEIGDTMAIFCPDYDDETRHNMRKGSAEALDSWGGKLKRKLEYLVSLQEK